MEKINITAQTAEGFKKIEDYLSKLPPNILSQIESAKSGLIGIECIIRNKIEDKQRILLPNKVTQISDFGNYIGIYCDEYFFKITGDLYKRKHEFVFIECEKL